MVRSIALLTLVAILLAGCGGPSKAETIKKGDAICRDAAERTPDNPTESLEALKETASVGEDALNDLKGLDAPKEGQEQFNRFISALDDQTGTFNSIVEATDDSDGFTEEDQAELFPEFNSKQREAQAAADAFGFTDCDDL